MPKNDHKQFNGLIQHSFALRVVQAHAPFLGPSNLDRIRERFRLPAGNRGGEFEVNQVGAEEGAAAARNPASHSPLVPKKKTSIGVRELSRLKPTANGDPTGEFPDALSWAVGTTAKGCNTYEEPRLILAGAIGGHPESTCNDFLVARRNSVGDSECDAVEISATLLEVIAHRRSRLFGLALGNRFINVMLPHAILTEDGFAGRVWLLQPLVTLICNTRDARKLRSTYSLSIFLLPVGRGGSKLKPREMSRRELRPMVNAGWGLATSPSDTSLPSFDLHGPLLEYLNRLAHPNLDGLSESGGPLKLRRFAELVAFGVSLRMSQGSRQRATGETVEEIGDDVITALGSARVSSLVVVDGELTKREVRERSKKKWTAPGNLVPLMRKLSGDSHIPKTWTRAERDEYRLDRPFTDGDEAVVGVLPHSRCLIVASAHDAQCGRLESALMQAGSVAHMNLGAATAIGMLRAIDRDLEKMGGTDPTKITEIDSEIATDLNDIYDLDITRESYRIFYRRLRNSLGITGDYETLQGKMESLYRAASTKSLEKSNRLLVSLTVLAIFLALLQVLKPGG